MTEPMLSLLRFGGGCCRSDEEPSHIGAYLHGVTVLSDLTGNAEVVDCVGGHALIIHIILSLVRNVAPRAKLSLGTIDSLVEHDRKVQQCDS